MISVFVASNTSYHNLLLTMGVPFQFTSSNELFVRRCRQPWIVVWAINAALTPNWTRISSWSVQLIIARKWRLIKNRSVCVPSVSLKWNSCFEVCCHGGSLFFNGVRSSGAGPPLSSYLVFNIILAALRARILGIEAIYTTCVRQSRVGRTIHLRGICHEDRSCSTHNVNEGAE